MVHSIDDLVVQETKAQMVDKPFPQDGALRRQLRGPRKKGKGGRQVLLGSAFPLNRKLGRQELTKQFWWQMGGAGIA